MRDMPHGHHVEIELRENSFTIQFSWHLLIASLERRRGKNEVYEANIDASVVLLNKRDRSRCENCAQTFILVRTQPSRQQAHRYKVHPPTSSRRTSVSRGFLRCLLLVS